MQNNEKIICKMFELELWLYLDRVLPDDRVEFWRNHLRSCKYCSEVLSQTEDVISTASQNLSFDLSDEVFNKMIDKAINNKKPSIKEFLIKPRRQKFVHISKVAFASALVILAVVISLLSDKPNTIKNVSKEILDWNDNLVDTQLNEIKSRIEFIQAENMEGWAREVNQIDTKINQLEKNEDPLSFY